MDWHHFFNVRDGVQYDMHLHGSRFIVVEFALATVLEAGLLMLSINYAFRMPDWPWWYLPWLIVLAGMILNSITIWILARQITQKEGARPRRPHSDRGIWLLPVLVVTPLVLPLLAWLQRNQKEG